MTLSRTISRKCSSLDATIRAVLGTLNPFSWHAIPRFVAARTLHRHTCGERRDGHRRQPQKTREAQELVAGDAHRHRIRHATGAAFGAARTGKRRKLPG